MGKRLLLVLALCGTAWAGHAQRNGAFCDLKGAVFVVPDRSQATFRVFIEKSEAFADLSVYKAPNLLFADRGGLWFFSTTRAQAAFTVAFVAEKALADFSIYYIENESFAGCR